MNVVLIGYRGCGKTTVGRALARRLGWPFLDTDQIIQERAGTTIREIIGTRGEQGFRELEDRAVAQVAGLDRHVIGTGGGAVLREENVRLLKQTGKLVYLTAKPDELCQRILGDADRRFTRPATDAHSELEKVRQALIEREPVYTRVADLIIHTSNAGIESIVQQILTGIGPVRS